MSFHSPFYGNFIFSAWMVNWLYVRLMVFIKYYLLVIMKITPISWYNILVWHCRNSLIMCQYRATAQPIYVSECFRRDLFLFLVFSDKIQLPSPFDVNQTLTFIIKIGLWVTFIFMLIVDIVFVEKFTSNLNKVIHIKSVFAFTLALIIIWAPYYFD